MIRSAAFCQAVGQPSHVGREPQAVTRIVTRSSAPKAAHTVQAPGLVGSSACGAHSWRGGSEGHIVMAIHAPVRTGVGASAVRESPRGRVVAVRWYGLIGPRTPLMGHPVREKTNLLARVRRIRGQVEALERALEAEKGCAEVVQQIAAVRGAMSGLMTEVIEDHVQTHTASPSITRNADRAQRRRRTYRGRSRLSEVAARSTTQQDH